MDAVLNRCRTVTPQKVKGSAATPAAWPSSRPGAGLVPGQPLTHRAALRLVVEMEIVEQLARIVLF